MVKRLDVNRHTWAVYQMRLNWDNTKTYEIRILTAAATVLLVVFGMIPAPTSDSG